MMLPDVQPGKEPFFYDDLHTLLRLATATAFAFVGVLAMVRVSGKTTLARMTVFDFLFTIALGSMLASVAINKNIPILDGLVAAAVLVFLQFIFRVAIKHSDFLDWLLNGKPTLLFRNGEFLEKPMTKQNVTKQEVLGAIRDHGGASLRDIRAVVLETDGKLTVVPKHEGSDELALSDVEGSGVTPPPTAPCS